MPAVSASLSYYSTLVSTLDCGAGRRPETRSSYCGGVAGLQRAGRSCVRKGSRGGRDGGGKAEGNESGGEVHLDGG